MALKSSFMPEMVVKQATQQALFEDMWTVNAQNGILSDDLFVDDLLDFSKAGFVEDDEEEDDKNKAGSLSVSPQQQPDPPTTTFSLPNTEICVPFLQDLADLEWVSHFVDDESFTGYDSVENLTKPEAEGEVPVLTKPCITSPVQTKARSKRARTGGWVWSLGFGSTESSTTSSSVSSSSTTSSWLIYSENSLTAESVLGKSPAKKPKKKMTSEFPGGGSPVVPRRCSHCLVQKTPQWRTGPLGAKTLCNACGVRYKSGRLLPEYRPACSPTFSSEVHSNNHRKVLEMRRKKEGETGLAQPVQSF